MLAGFNGSEPGRRLQAGPAPPSEYPRDRGTRQELLDRAGDVLGWVARGELTLRIGHVYPLAEAAQAHRDLEARGTTGKLLLRPV